MRQSFLLSKSFLILALFAALFANFACVGTPTKASDPTPPQNAMLGGDISPADGATIHINDVLRFTDIKFTCTDTSYFQKFALIRDDGQIYRFPGGAGCDGPPNGSYSTTLKANEFMGLFGHSATLEFWIYTRDLPAEISMPFYHKVVLHWTFVS